MMPRFRNGRSLIWFSGLSILLIVSSLFVKSRGYSNAIEKAKDSDQTSVCEPATPEVVTEVRTEIKREELVDRYHNRVACDLCQPGDVFCETVGKHNIDRAIGYAGSNYRLQKVFQKLRAGEPITFAVVGGSVSFGHGLYDAGFKQEKEGPGNLHWRIFNWINERYPHKDHKFINGAIPGGTSELFSFCFSEHIPEDSDLILAEFAVNDFPVTNTLNQYERLIRGLLDLPKQPAVINVEALSLEFNTIGFGDTQHQSIAQYYDTPVISLRNLVMPIIDDNATTIYDIFHTSKGPNPSVDPKHIGHHGHRMLANLTTAYFSRVLCQMDEIDRLSEIGIDVRKSEGLFLRYNRLNELPARTLMSKWYADAAPISKVKPQCMATNSKRSPLKQETSEGWVEWAWKDKPYLVGRKPGDVIRLKFHTTLGTASLFYQRSKKYGLGRVFCWVDDDENKGVYMDGYWDKDQSVPQSSLISDKLGPGDHLLSCRIQEDTKDPGGGHEFRITTLVAI